jgi:hypothetical protein
MGLWGKIKKYGAPVAGALVAGPAGAAIGALATNKGLRNKAKDFLLGQNPDDVELPPEVAAAKERRAGMLAELMSGGSRTAVSDAAKAAAAQAGRTQSARLVQQQESLAAGARGLGVLGARRAAMRNAALGQGDIAGQVADASTQGAVQAANADEQRRLAQLGMAADLTSADEAAALNAEEYQKRNARQGMLGTVLGTLGAAGGAYVGGPQGAQIGGQVGYQAGTAMQRR